MYVTSWLSCNFYIFLSASKHIEIYTVTFNICKILYCSCVNFFFFFGNVIYIIHVDKNFLFHKIYLILNIVQNLLITDEHRGSQRVKQSTINKARHSTFNIYYKRLV